MKKTPLISLVLAAALLLSGCHSSRKTTRGDLYDKADIEVAKPVKTKPGKADKKDKSSLADKIEAEALAWLGTPYRYGGQDRNGTDCSGMVMCIYDKVADTALPRNSAEQQRFCTPIDRNELSKGDLVFFCTGRQKDRVSHVGIYLADGRFVHASTSKGVVVSTLDQDYYIRTFHSAGRVLEILAEAKEEENKPKEIPAPEQEIALPDTGSVREAFVPEPQPEADADSIRASVIRAMSF